MKEHVLLVDVQNDFCHPDGALYVPHAREDLAHLMQFLDKKIGDIDQVFVSLDSHWVYDIAHPRFWRKDNGLSPEPFSHVTLENLLNGDIVAINPIDQARAESYIKALEDKGSKHTLWPEHCILSTWGHALADEVILFLEKFQVAHQKAPEALLKGLNPYSEHFSVFSALIPDPTDASTQFNDTFAKKLLDCDRLYVGGQALSHCVGQTLIDLHAHVEDPRVLEKIVLLSDCTSAVQGFQGLASSYLERFESWGITIAKTKVFLS